MDANTAKLAEIIDHLDYLQNFNLKIEDDLKTQFSHHVKYHTTLPEKYHDRVVYWHKKLIVQNS